MCNKSPCLLILVAALLLFCIIPALAELPSEPNAEELCEQADLLVRAEPIRDHGDTHTIADTKYRTESFKIHRIYKGHWETNEIRVLIPFQWNWDCPRRAAYQKGKTYFLFLDKHQARAGGVQYKGLWIRIGIDDVFPEREWSRNREQCILEELAALADPNRFSKRGDNLDYCIPKEAEEKAVELTLYQREHKFLRRVEYWRNGALVGERAWRGNGQLAYERSIKNGLRHGTSRGWYPDGAPFHTRPLRKDRLHGILKTWYKKGVLEVHYYIRGKPVSEEVYRKACKTNKTLEAIKNKGSQQASEPYK